MENKKYVEERLEVTRFSEMERNVSKLKLDTEPVVELSIFSINQRKIELPMVKNDTNVNDYKVMSKHEEVATTKPIQWNIRKLSGSREDPWQGQEIILLAELQRGLVQKM